MTKLHSIYQRSVGEKEDFLRCIIPLVLGDVRFKEFQDRDAYAEHWTTLFKTMDQSLTKLATEQKLSRVAVDDFRRYKAMQKWYLDVGDILAYVNDVLSPHGFDEVVKDDFAGLREMLQQRPDDRAPTPQVRFRRLRLPRTTLETRPPPQRLRRHLLPQVQTQKHHRRYFPCPNPRS
jgi:hypothetical protein